MRPFIEELTKDGFQVVVTSRDHANTLELLDRYQIENTEIGRHYGSSKLKKVFGLIYRSILLVRFLWPIRKSIKVAFSQSSFYSPVVASILGLFCVYTNDNENAQGNLVAGVLADRIFLPKCMGYLKFSNSKKQFLYPGVKEGIYLWKYFRAEAPRDGKNIYYRPGAVGAAYYRDHQLDEVNKLFQTFPRDTRIFVLCRDADQKRAYKKLLQNYANVVVPDQTISLEEIVNDCSLFLSSGGSMLRELAVLGIPSVSLLPRSPPKVDKYLEDKGLLRRGNIQRLETVLDREEARVAEDQLVYGEQAYFLIYEELVS